jgi:hypothetical protein
MLMARKSAAFCDEGVRPLPPAQLRRAHSRCPEPDTLLERAIPGAVGIGGVPLLFALDSELELAGARPGVRSSWPISVAARLADEAGGGMYLVGEAGYYGGGGEGSGDCGVA